MAYIINENDSEPAMRYEGIARHAFNCDRLGDPHAIADASFFDSEFIPTLTLEGLNAMKSILDQIVKIEVSEFKITEFKKVKESLSVGMDQEKRL